MYKAVIIDTETTGRKRETAQVIELAYAYASISLGGVILEGKHVSRHRPLCPIEYGALATHHILPHEVDQFRAYAPAVDCPPAEYFIGHNIDFDWTVLGKPNVRRICTLALARKLWPECDSHSLSALMYFLFPDQEATRQELKSAHSAAADILFTAKILSKILGALPDIATFEDLWVTSEDARVPRIMTFGKHKDKPVQHVDPGYRKWYRGTDDQDEYVLKAFDWFPYNPAFQPE